MYSIRRVADIVLLIVLAVLLVTGVGSLVTGNPVLATVVRSDSMVPVYTRGDIAIVWNWAQQYSPGDVVLFVPQEGTLAGVFTLHRIVKQDSDGLFRTKGDAAVQDDQTAGLAGRIARAQMLAKAVCIGGIPLKIPRVGIVSLWIAESPHAYSRIMVIGAMLLMVVLSAFELRRSRRRSRLRAKPSPSVLLVALGVLLVSSLSALTLIQTKQIDLVYEVGQSAGVISGQPIGILMPGESVSRQVANIQNSGFLPMYVLVSSDDPSVSVGHALHTLRPGESQQIIVEVNAVSHGEFRSRLRLSLVFPILPASAIAVAASVNHYLGALLGPSLVGFVMLTLWLLDPATRRWMHRRSRKLLRLRL
jgi:signal peptidase